MPPPATSGVLMRRFKLSAELAEVTVNDQERTIDLDGMSIPLSKIKEYIKTIDRDPVPVDIKTPFILNTDLTKRWDLSVNAMAFDHLVRFENVDFSKPIIVLQESEVLDGMHRVIMALNQGKEEIPGYILTMEELAKIGGYPVTEESVPAQEVLGAIVGTILIAPVVMLCVALPISIIADKIKQTKDKKDPTRVADDLIKNCKENDGSHYYSYPMVSDVDDDGNPMWVPIGKSYYNQFELAPPVTVRLYMKKISNVLQKLANVSDTNTFPNQIESVLISEFGRDAIKVDKSGLIDESWIDAKEEPVVWPSNPWYNLKEVKGPKGSITEFSAEYAKWSKTLIPFLERIKKNVKDITISKPVDDKNEMASRLIYLKLAFGLLKWADEAYHYYWHVCSVLSDESNVMTNDDDMTD